MRLDEISQATAQSYVDKSKERASAGSDYDRQAKKKAVGSGYQGDKKRNVPDENWIRGLDRARGKVPTSEARVDEISTKKLADYKKAAGKDASAADKAGDFERGNKRFSGIIKATKKQFDNDAKKNSSK